MSDSTLESCFFATQASHPASRPVPAKQNEKILSKQLYVSGQYWLESIQWLTLTERKK